jgi:hypothetical protein
MKSLLIIAAMTLPTAAAAQTVTVKPLVDVRLRYEDDSQDGLADKARPARGPSPRRRRPTSRSSAIITTGSTAPRRAR